MRVFVWCVVVPRLGLSVLWSRGECGSGMIRCVRSRRFTVFVLIGLWGLLLGDLMGLGGLILVIVFFGWDLVFISKLWCGSGSCEVSVLSGGEL